MTAEDVLGREPRERARREETEERVHAEPLLRREEVRSGPERIGDHERSPLRPPERSLAPERKVHGPEHLERGTGRVRARHEVERDAVRLRKRRRVAAMPVEQLEDTGRSPGGADSLLEPVHVHRVHEPDLPVRESACEAR